MKRLLVLLLIVTLLLAVGVALSAPDSPNISWWTVDGGGAVPKLSGGSLTLQGTAGQPDAGGMQNGRFTLSGGYWNEATRPGWRLYMPIVAES